MDVTDDWKPWTFYGYRLAREIILTSACVDMAAKRLGKSHTDVRRFLLGCLETAGVVTASPKDVIRGLRSISGYFAVVPGIFVLPLRVDVKGTNRPVATRCKFSPSWLVENQICTLPDPFALSGLSLVQHVEFSRHCIDRFQERCGGNPDRIVAEQQLARRIAPTAQAAGNKPPWVKSLDVPPDFYLIADKICLPIRNFGDYKSFEAASFFHEDMGSVRTTMTVRCRCGHLNEVLRSAAGQRDKPRCEGCGKQMNIQV